MSEDSSELITEIGTVVIAIIVVAGLVVLQILGKPTDGLEPGMLAVLGFFFGGQMAKGAATKAVSKASSLIDATIHSPAEAAPSPAASVPTNETQP